MDSPFLCEQEILLGQSSKTSESSKIPLPLNPCLFSGFLYWIMNKSPINMINKGISLFNPSQHYNSMPLFFGDSYGFLYFHHEGYFATHPQPTPEASPSHESHAWPPHFLSPALRNICRASLAQSRASSRFL